MALSVGTGPFGRNPAGTFNFEYDEPHGAVQAIAGLLAFYNENVELEVDGEAWESPRTKFS